MLSVLTPAGKQRGMNKLLRAEFLAGGGPIRGRAVGTKRATGALTHLPSVCSTGGARLIQGDSNISYVSTLARPKQKDLLAIPNESFSALSNNGELSLSFNSTL